MQCALQLVSNIAAWSNWGAWFCSVTCGRGTETRTRTCSFGNNCIGNSIDSRDCTRTDCPCELHKS